MTDTNHFPGKGCTCAAYSESECACDADWTDPEVYKLRAANVKLKRAANLVVTSWHSGTLDGGRISDLAEAADIKEE